MEDNYDDDQHDSTRNYSPVEYLHYLQRAEKPERKFTRKDWCEMVEQKYPNLGWDPWLVECGDGWLFLLEPIFDCVNEWNRENSGSSESEDRIQIEQIKTKWASLRIYYSPPNDYIDGMVRMAEFLSTKFSENPKE